MTKIQFDGFVYDQYFLQDGWKKNYFKRENIISKTDWEIKKKKK